MKRDYDVWVAVILVLLITVVTVAFDVISENRVYAENDAGKAIEARAGTSLIIKLEENPSTGFNWQWTVSPDDLIILDLDQFIPSKTEDTVGVEGLHEYKFKAYKTGDAVIRFDYYQPWEPDNIEKTYVYSIKVVN